MDTEMNALLKNKTWSLVPYHPIMNLVGCKWIFKLKHKLDGSVDRYKARLVAKNFHQQTGLEYGEIFSPVIKPIIVRTVCSLAVSKGCSIRHLDVNNAFCMVFLLKQSTWNNFWNSSNPLVPIMYASFTVISMASNRLYGPGFSSQQLSSLMGFVGSKSNSLSSSDGSGQIFFWFLFMWTTSSS